MLVSCSGDKGIADYMDELKNADLAPFATDNQCGFINAEGEFVEVPSNIVQTYLFHEGLARVTDSLGLGGYVNTKGEIVIAPKYADLTDFSDGLAWVAEEDSVLRVIDTKGNTVFRCPEAYTAEMFFNGYSVITRIDGTMAFVNKKGTVYAVPDSLRDIALWPDNIVSAKVVDKKGDKLYKFGNGTLTELPVSTRYDKIYWNYLNNQVFVKQGGNYGVVNLDGEYLINPRYSELISDGDWWYAYQDDEKHRYGWLDGAGEIVIKPKYKQVSIGFGKGEYAVVTTNGEKYQIIDREGKTVVPAKYDRISDFDGTYFIVCKNLKWGIVDASTGEVTCDPQYSEIEAVGKVLLATFGDYRWCAIDVNGKPCSDMMDASFSRMIEGQRPGVSCKSNTVNTESIAAVVNDYVVQAQQGFSLNLGEMIEKFHADKNSIEGFDFINLTAKSIYEDKFVVRLNVYLDKAARTYHNDDFDNSNSTINTSALPTEYSISVTAKPGSGLRQVAEAMQKQYGWKLVEGCTPERLDSCCWIIVSVKKDQTPVIDCSPEDYVEQEEY